MLAARAANALLGRSALISFLGELGDKTFYVTTTLSIWCPWGGLRNGQHALAERCLVGGGAFVAFALRGMVLASFGNADEGCWPAAFACVVLATLGIIAIFGKRRANEAESKQMLKSSSHDEESPWNKAAFSSSLPWTADVGQANSDASKGKEASVNGAQCWNTAAFHGALPSQQQVANEASGAAAVSYGSVAAPVGQTSKSSISGSSNEEDLYSILIAFPLSFFLNLAMESDDKSEAALLKASHGTQPGIMIGAILGFLPAVVMAVVLGHILERQMQSQQALFLVAFLLWSLCMISMSQAMLRLPVLQPAALAAVQISTRIFSRRA
mmetsp:Transcript_35652/g.70514  ORF Transcript_35652/g.70514 Transcript_35652/m.70514 type:complete len:327 (-) Transcript_35652:18-998(-)